MIHTPKRTYFDCTTRREAEVAKIPGPPAPPQTPQTAAQPQEKTP